MAKYYSDDLIERIDEADNMFLSFTQTRLAGHGHVEFVFMLEDGTELRIDRIEYREGDDIAAVVLVVES